MLQLIISFSSVNRFYQSKFLLIAIFYTLLVSPFFHSQEKQINATNYETQLTKARELFYTNPQNAIELTKKLSRQAESEGNTKYRIKSLSILVQGYLLLNDYESALKEALLMEELALKEKD